MKTFEMEYQELVKWFKNADVELDKTFFDEPLAHDGEYTQKHKKLVREYNLRLYELGKKYNLDVRNPRYRDK